MNDTTDTSNSPPEPMLRIETGQHTAVIRRLDVDHEGRFLVTGSDDKTARVWALPEGRLLHVLRPPVGSGAEGKVNAVAISPDGATVAVGGTDVTAHTTGCSVYLFDRENGRLLRRLPEVKSTIIHLAFSPDGAFLVAALSWSGIRVWRTDDWDMVFADQEYGDKSYSCVFHQSGRLATTCCDGLVRLYEPLEKNSGFRLIYKRQMPVSRQLNAIAFSPDGERLAIGYHDANEVIVLSSSDLSSLFSPQTAGIENGHLSSVAWSADGRFLYASGDYLSQNGVSRILRWEDGGKGQCTWLQAARDTVMDLKPWCDSGVLFAAADPRFGGFDGDGAMLLDHGPETADMRRKYGDAFTVSHDGHSLRFGLGKGDMRPVRFDLHLRKVTTDVPVDAAFTPACREADGFTLERWDADDAPKLVVNHVVLYLEKYEDFHSVAIAPDGKRLLLGAEWSLRLYNPLGIELWRREMPDIAWGVNIPTNGMLAIVACADGTIRWHRLEDGEELLALFVHPDRRWVAWTPQGYFDASAGADGLIGWQVNRGLDEAADFFPVWQFRQRFYRPDVVSRVLNTLDVAEALRQADAAANRETQAADTRVLLRASPPPSIDILTPKDGAAFDKHEVTIRYLLRYQGDALQGELWSVVEGRPEQVNPLSIARTQGAEECEVTLWLPPQDVTVELEFRVGEISGRSPAIRMRWAGPAPQPRPTLYLLAVGVSEYKYYKPPLRYADRDAQEFAEAMRKQVGLMYEKVEVRTLPNDQASCAEVLGGLQWLTERAQITDVAIVFLSGHGLTDREGSYYFLPHNFELSNLWGTSVPQEMLTKLLRQIKAMKRIVFIDTCHAGAATAAGTIGVAEASFEAHVDVDRLANELYHATGIVVLTSSTGNQDSIEHDDWQHGAFTKAVLDGLAGAADFVTDDVITTAELNLYLDFRVKQLTSNRQTPACSFKGTNFPIARVTS